MTTMARQDLERDLGDPEFRKLYGAAEAKSELAIALADARHKLGLTQEDMSKRVEVSQPYIARLEGGDANPTIGAIGSMLAILDLRINVETIPLLPQPVSAGSVDICALIAPSGYEPAADASGIVMMSSPMAAYNVGSRGQQALLFPTDDYDPFRPSPEVGDFNIVWTRSPSHEGIIVGGHRV